MTVTYTHCVASCTGFGCFWKLLFRWRGSIYKLVWPTLIIYGILYAAASVTYRVLLSQENKRLFEKVSLHCQQFTELIPVAFVLGFYVSIVVQRWWEQYMSLPWPDALALFVSTSIVGQNERSRVMRRTVMRYVNLAFVLTLSMISPNVKKRFPTLEHVMQAGFMTASEKKIFDDMNAKTAHPKYWMPLVWAGAIITRARKEGLISDDFAVKTLLDEISKFRGLCGGLLSYDWISIPLVYTQVVTLAVYTFFLGTIMGRQFLDEPNSDQESLDMYVPLFTFLQFFFYMGWLKVAESLVNPFGEDDDDFEVNWLIDRNLQVSYLVVDEMHEEHPELIQDVYWDEVFPQQLPYTEATESCRRIAPQGSTFNMHLFGDEHECDVLMPLMEDEEQFSSDVKIRMTGGRSDESLASSGSGIAMKSASRSAASRSAASLGRRNESMVSVLLHRLLHAGGSGRRRFSSANSTRKTRSYDRSSSRLSTLSSTAASKSQDSISSQQHRGQESSTAALARPGVLRLDSYREVSLEDDGTILIRIKNDGRTYASHRIASGSIKRSSSADTAATSTTSNTTSTSTTTSTSITPKPSGVSLTTDAGPTAGTKTSKFVLTAQKSSSLTSGISISASRPLLGRFTSLTFPRKRTNSSHKKHRSVSDAVSADSSMTHVGDQNLSGGQEDTSGCASTERLDDLSRSPKSDQLLDRSLAGAEASLEHTDLDITTSGTKYRNRPPSLALKSEKDVSVTFSPKVENIVIDSLVQTGTVPSSLREQTTPSSILSSKVNHSDDFISWTTDRCAAASGAAPLNTVQEKETQLEQAKKTISDEAKMSISLEPNKPAPQSPTKQTNLNKVPLSRRRGLGAPPLLTAPAGESGVKIGAATAPPKYSSVSSSHNLFFSHQSATSMTLSERFSSNSSKDNCDLKTDEDSNENLL